MIKIKQLRKERGLSQRALAEQIGCSQKSIDCWEKGVSEPTAGFITALADCFACSADYLLDREDDFGHVHVDFPADPRMQSLLAAYLSLPEDSRASLLSYANFLKNNLSR